jgi:nicotinamidase-related amidase
MTKRALIVVDLQNDYFASAFSSEPGSTGMSRALFVKQPSPC